MNANFSIGSTQLSLENIHQIITENMPLQLCDEAAARIVKCRQYLDEKMARQEDPIYGINTGFGSLYNIKIKRAQLEKLQENLVMSHACGTGEEAPSEIVKLMMLLKIQNMSLGHSGVQLTTVQRMIAFYNADCIPVVYQLGSLGASGDLAPLAHLSLPLLGKGEVDLQGERLETSEALKKLNLAPITLRSKEGLALLNGTQFMSAYGIYNLIKSYKTSYLADLIGAISLEGYDGRPEAFDHKYHDVRGQKGQIKTAENIREFLEGSELIARHKEHVQDPYSFRCMPQVHGATKDTLAHVRNVFETEINAVTDNPIVFPDEDDVISGGNFHGQPLALALDFLAIAMAELGNISERRVYQLINGRRGLPPFLVAEPGLNSGFMIPQYTAASIVSQNKQYCTPASIDSIESSNGQEDHVSMGANAATKLHKVVENLQQILGIELLNATQALAFRKGKTSPFLQSFVDSYREVVPFVETDRILHNDLIASRDFIEGLSIDTDILYS